MKKDFPGRLAERYDIDENRSDIDILEDIAVKRGCLKMGILVDIDKAADIVKDEFRGGKIGKISLERP